MKNRIPFFEILKSVRQLLHYAKKEYAVHVVDSVPKSRRPIAPASMMASPNIVCSFPWRLRVSKFSFTE